MQDSHPADQSLLPKSGNFGYTSEMDASAVVTVDIHVFKRGGRRPLFLVLRRAPDVSYAGLWRMVTGTVEPGEKATHTVLRKLREETGLAPTGLWALDYVHLFYDVATDRILQAPVFAVEVPDVPVRLSPMHSHFRWVEFEQALDLYTWPGHRDGMQRTQEDVLGSRERGKAFRVAIPT